MKFSRAQGQELLRQAAERGIPVWSFDQWLVFWEARDTWRLEGITWKGSTLQFTLEGRTWHDGLGVTLPEEHGGAPLREVRLDGDVVGWDSVLRYGQRVALVALPAGSTAVSVSARYGAVRE